MLSNSARVATPADWVDQTQMDITHIGPNFQNLDFEFQLQITSDYTRMKSQNVIGYIRGSEFPDEYVLIGNHRDSCYGLESFRQKLFKILKLNTSFEIRKN